MSHYVEFRAYPIPQISGYHMNRYYTLLERIAAAYMKKYHQQKSGRWFSTNNTDEKRGDWIGMKFRLQAAPKEGEGRNKIIWIKV